MKVAVFTGSIPGKSRKEMIDYATTEWEFAGEYSDLEKLMEDAGKRVIERRGDSFHVIEEGNFSHVLVFDSNSIPEETVQDLYSVFGIEVINFRKQMEMEKTEKEEPEEVQAILEDEGDYKRVELL